MRGCGNVSIASDLGNILERGGKAFGRIREITKALASLSAQFPPSPSSSPRELPCVPAHKH